MKTLKLTREEIVNAAIRSIPDSSGLLILIASQGYWLVSVDKFSKESIPNWNVLLSTGELRLVVPFLGSYLPVKEVSRVTDSLSELLILTIDGLEGETVRVIPIEREVPHE
jgi:hypothetical protein